MREQPQIKWLRASGIARRRTEKERAEALFPLRATTTAAGSSRDARVAPNRNLAVSGAAAVDVALDCRAHFGYQVLGLAIREDRQPQDVPADHESQNL